EFFASRQKLLRQLDGQLKAAFLNKRLNLGPYERLRRDLKISTKSLVHHWSKAGGPGQIPGYATHLDEVAKAAKYVKYGGHIGTALGGTSSYLKVEEVCRAGETEECKRIRFM
ncbi:PAAR domain-containing protein, partial [Pseudomonas shirazensis]